MRPDTGMPIDRISVGVLGPSGLPIFRHQSTTSRDLYATLPGDGVPLLGLRFRDAAGILWERSGMGRLTEIEETPVV